MATDNLTARYVATVTAQELDTTKLSIALEQINGLEFEALKRLDCVPPDFWLGVYTGTSGGKDSVAVHHLINKSPLYSLHKPSLPNVHTAKPGITHPKTLEFLYGQPNLVLHIPKSHPMPRYLKTQIDGTRASEYDRTDGRSTDIIVGGQICSREDMPLFVRNGLFGLNFVFPIYDWTDEQVWAYLFKNNIPYSDEYLESKHTNVINPGAK